MPNAIKKMKNKEKAREIRNKGRKKNYERGRFNGNKHKHFKPKEIALVMNSELKDFEIAKKLLKSVQAVQTLRCRINNGYYDNHLNELVTNGVFVK